MERRAIRRGCSKPQNLVTAVLPKDDSSSDEDDLFQTNIENMQANLKRKFAAFAAKEKEMEEEEETVLIKKSRKKSRQLGKKVKRNNIPASQLFSVPDSDGEIEDFIPGENLLNNDDDHDEVRSRSPTPPPAFIPSPSPVKRPVLDVLDTPSPSKRERRAAIRAKRKAKSAARQSTSEIEVLDVTASSQGDDIEVLTSSQEFGMLSPSLTTTRNLSVKIRSRSGIQRFSIRPDEPLQCLFDEMAAHEMVNENRLRMYLNDKIIDRYETADGVGLTIADIIDCHICKNAAAASDDLLDDSNSLRVYVQGKDPNSKKLMRIRPMEQMRALMERYANEVKGNLSAMTFYYDGEPLEVDDTPKELELEDDEIIDVTGL